MLSRDKLEYILLTEYNWPRKIVNEWLEYLDWAIKSDKWKGSDK